MYMSPSEGMVEEFFQTLAKQNNLPPNEPHIYAGDNDSHVGEETEAHLSLQEILKLPERIGDDEHPPEPNKLSVLNTQQITSKIYQSVTKNDRMSIHSNEPSCPLSKQELASWK